MMRISIAIILSITLSLSTVLLNLPGMSSNPYSVSFSM